MNPTTNGSRPRGAGVTAGILSLLALGGAAGCGDFLVTEPRGQLTSESFFETQDQAIQATNATYHMLRQWQVHVFAWIGMTDIASDDATKGSVPGDANFLGDLDNLIFDPGNIAFRDTWNGYYQGIYRANVAIQNLPNVPMPEALKARLIAENKFLRAYYYFFLVRAFGGVPRLTEPLTPGQFTQPRASAEEIYALIEQDLTDAIAALPERSQYAAADLGRASKGAARALLGAAHLYQKEYQPAYQALVQVIQSNQHSLHASYATLFTQAGENGSESVFEVQAVAVEQRGGGSQYAEVQGVRAPPNIGWGFNTPSAELEAAFDPGDPRLQATILYPWEHLPDAADRVVYLNPSMPNNRFNQKAYTSPNTPGGAGNSGVNIRRIRYADVLLMGAEAAHRIGRTAEAQSWLNQVRQRARAGQTVTLGFSPERLAEPIATSVLGLAPGTSRVFVRYVNPAAPAYAAGVRGFTFECGDAAKACPSSAVPPVRVIGMDLVQAVDGTPVTTLESYHAALSGKAPGASVTLQLLRVTQPTSGATNSQPLTVSIPARALLPDVTATGQALLEAIWAERRTELAMEQHRWFDLMRQNREASGRAAAFLAQHGKAFRSHQELYPVPAAEVLIAGLSQNPGY